MTVSVVVPWRAGCPYRQTAWGWVEASLEAEYPDWEIIEGTCPDGPWRKGLAVADGISRASGDRIVMHDADVWVPELAGAVAFDAPVVKPHRFVHRLTEEASARFMAGAGDYETEVKPYVGMQGGGVLVIDREVWDEAPMDPRFEGWGQEDFSWVIAIRCLIGPPAHLHGDLFHLWHPPQPRQDRATGSPESRTLQLRYEVAEADRDAMRDLIAEFKGGASCLSRPINSS